MKEIKMNEYWIHLFEAVDASVEDFTVLFEFWKAGDATEQETKEAFDKEQEKINERMEQLRAMEEYSRGVEKVSQELFGLGTNAENRNR
jgi:hypothetical protein